MRDPRYYIGIDPGSNTGFAVWDTVSKTFRVVTTMTATAARARIMQEYSNPTSCAVIYFEDARQRKWLPREKSSSEYRGKLMGAGSVKRDCELWEEFCRYYGFDYKAIPPKAGATKWGAEFFASVTGVPGRTSNHARDAAMLVFQK